MRIDSVKDIRQFFIDELKDEAFTIDKTGQKTIEMIGANFIADEPAIFGEPSQAYINSELAWYESQSTNINDIYGPSKPAPAAWQYSADPHGNINSNYGHLVFSKNIITNSKMLLMNYGVTLIAVVHKWSIIGHLFGLSLTKVVSLTLFVPTHKRFISAMAF